MNDRHLGDDAELYALGALDDDEIAAAERHLAVCDACAAQVARARDVVAALAAPLRAYPPPAIGFPPPAAVAPARAARPGWDRRLAALAAVAVLGLGIAGWQDVVLTRQRASADLALAAIVHGHFSHAGFTPGAAGAPAAKVLYARDGAWLYLVVDRPEAGLRLLAEAPGAAPRLLGVTRASGAVATLYVERPGRVGRLVLEDARGTVGTATPSY